MENKYWLQSKTVLYNIATIAMGIVAFLGVFGFVPDNATVSKTTKIAEDLAVILAAFGPFVNLYLRTKTVQGITFKK